MIPRTERDLEVAAEHFFISRGHTYKFQVPVSNRIIDLACITPDGYVVGVEFKLKNWSGVLKQAIRNVRHFDFMYVCMPDGNFMHSLTEGANNAGIGVLVYRDPLDGVRVELPAVRNVSPFMPYIENVKKYITGENPGGKMSRE